MSDAHPVVYRICSDDVLREQIQALEKDPWLARRLSEMRGETNPDDWTPRHEVLEMARAGVRVVSIDITDDGEAEPPWWNLWLTTLVNLDLDRKILAELTKIADASGADICELWKVCDRLVVVRDPKKTREPADMREQLAHVAHLLAQGKEIGMAADFAGIERRKFERFRKDHPLQWEQIEKRVHEVKSKSDKKRSS